MFCPVSEHILRTRIKTHLGYASIRAVYAPTNPTTDNEVTVSDEFYKHLQATLTVVPTRDMVLLKKVVRLGCISEGCLCGSHQLKVLIHQMFRQLTAAEMSGESKPLVGEFRKENPL